jgi:hypothetical protein
MVYIRNSSTCEVRAEISGARSYPLLHPNFIASLGHTHETPTPTPKQEDHHCHLRTIGLCSSPPQPRQGCNRDKWKPRGPDRIRYSLRAAKTLLSTISIPLLCDLTSTPQLALSRGNESSGGRRASIRQTQTGSGFQQNLLFVLEGILVSAHRLAGKILATSGRELDSAVLSFLWAQGPLSK